MADICDQFFVAYKASNYEAVSALFHPEFEFSDPAFPDLKGKRAKAMFHMFCTNALTTKMVVTPSPAEAIPGQDGKFKVEYTCDYLFGARKVHNPITAVLEVRDGKILRQVDTFDLKAWAKQALGFLVGTVLGAIGILPGIIHKRAEERLKGWCDKNEEFKE